MDKRERQFREAATRAIATAQGLVTERDDYNRIVALPDMFPHGIQDLAYELHKKSSRLLGLIQASVDLPVGNWEQCKVLLKEARDHAIDMINYGAFAVAQLDDDLDEGGQQNTPERLD